MIFRKRKTTFIQGAIDIVRSTISDKSNIKLCLGVYIDTMEMHINDIAGKLSSKIFNLEAFVI